MIIEFSPFIHKRKIVELQGGTQFSWSDLLISFIKGNTTFLVGKMMSAIMLKIILK